MDYSPPGSSVQGFSSQDYWSELPSSPPRDLPNPGVKPKSLMSPALASGFFTLVQPWKPNRIQKLIHKYICVFKCTDGLCIIQKYWVSLSKESGARLKTYMCFFRSDYKLYLACHTGRRESCLPHKRLGAKPVHHSLWREVQPRAQAHPGRSHSSHTGIPDPCAFILKSLPLSF